MITSTDRMALDRAKGLMATVGGAMRRVSAALAGLSAPEDFSARHDAALVEAELPELSAAMRQAYAYIADGWNDIRDNEVRLYEVFLFVQEYRKFREAAVSFDEICGEDALAGEVFSDLMAVHEYYLLVAKYDRLLRPVLEDTARYEGTRRYPGLAEALRGYVGRTDDAMLEAVISGGEAPARKLRWVGPLNEATLFGQYFGLSCKRMNECFAFRGKDGRAVSLNYTHNRLNNDVKEYPIFDILVKFSPAR